MEDSINKIIAIGKKGNCSLEKMLQLLPNYPTLRGSESVFNGGFISFSEYNIKQIEHYIRGLHLIELKYREEQKHDSGFGSPSRTHHLILRLEKRHPKLSLSLLKWIADNGGNYYIKVPKPIEISIEGLFDN